MNYHWTIPLLASMASLALSAISLRSGIKTSLGRVFTLLALILVFWNLNFFILYYWTDRELVFTLTRISRAVSVFLPPAVLHLAVELARRAQTRWRYALLVDYCVSIGLFVANLSDLLIADIKQGPWGFSSIGTPLYDVFSVFVLLNFLGSAALMLYAYRTSRTPRARLQMRFWLLGSSVALPLGLTNLLPNYGVPIYPLGSLGSAVWAGIVAYAIVRHRLMDIDLALTRGASYAIVSAILIAPAFVAALWFQQLSFGNIHTDFSFALLCMLLAVGILFPTLRVRTQVRLEQSLFPDKHRQRDALSAFSRSIVRILDTGKLIQTLAETLSEAFDVEQLVVAYRADSTSSLQVSQFLGPAPTTNEIAISHPLAEILARRQEAVLVDEFESDPAYRQRKEAASFCKENGWEVCVPLMTAERLIGFISFGRKRNLTPFYVEDLSILETVAAGAAIALENARLYGELKKSRDIIRRADKLSALGTLAAGIAHEIRNPLVSIQTFFQLAPSRLQDKEFLTEFLDLASSEVTRIADLITELLGLAQSPTPMSSQVDLNDLVDSVSRLIEPHLRTSRITVVRSLAASLQPTEADPDQMRQVFLNLMLNATEAMEPGGQLRLSSREVLLEGERFCQIEIQDTGCGIPEEMLDNIFNPFFTTKDKGTGLGLAISEQVVREQGGFISVESVVGRGTTFRVHCRAVMQESESSTFADEGGAPEPLRQAAIGRSR